MSRPNRHIIGVVTDIRLAPRSSSGRERCWRNCRSCWSALSAARDGRTAVLEQVRGSDQTAPGIRRRLETWSKGCHMADDDDPPRSPGKSGAYHSLIEMTDAGTARPSDRVGGHGPSRRKPGRR